MIPVRGRDLGSAADLEILGPEQDDPTPEPSEFLWGMTTDPGWRGDAH